MLNRFIFPYLFIATSLTLTGCYNNNNSDDFDTSSISSSIIQANQLKEDSSKRNEQREIVNDLKKLPSIGDVKSSFSFGQNNPFSKNSIDTKESIVLSLTLKGIIFHDSTKLALIEYRDYINELKEGYIGDQGNNYLPQGVKLEAIDIEKEMVILSLNNQTVSLYIDQKNN